MNDLKKLNAKRDILSIITTFESIVKRINEIEDKFELEIQKLKQGKSNKKLGRKGQNIKSSRNSKARDKEELKHFDPVINDKSNDQLEFRGNSYIEQVVREIQQPVQNYKQNVKSIHQILSREMNNVTNKKTDQEHQDDQRTKKRELAHNQNNWSSFKLAKASDSDSQ